MKSEISEIGFTQQSDNKFQDSKRFIRIGFLIMIQIDIDQTFTGKGFLAENGFIDCDDIYDIDRAV